MSWICSECNAKCLSKCVRHRSVFMRPVNGMDRNSSTCLGMLASVEDSTICEGGVSIKIDAYSIDGLLGLMKAVIEHPEWVKQSYCSHKWILVGAEDCKLGCGTHQKKIHRPIL